MVNFTAQNQISSFEKNENNFDFFKYTFLLKTYVRYDHSACLVTDLEMKSRIFVKFQIKYFKNQTSKKK